MLLFKIRLLKTHQKRAEYRLIIGTELKQIQYSSWGLHIFREHRSTKKDIEFRKDYSKNLQKTQRIEL